MAVLALAAACYPGIAAGGAAPTASPVPPAEAAVDATAGAPETAPLPPTRPGGETAALAPSRTPPPAPPPERAEPHPPAEDLAPSEHALATSPRPVPRPGLRNSTLIGIFSLTTGKTALVRFPGGGVMKLSVGDTVDGWRVSAIASDRMRVTRGSENRTFMLLGK